MTPAEKTALESAREELEAARSTMQKKADELDRLEKLTTRYPDLSRHTGRWNRVVHCSTLVNEQVDRVYFRYNCGCCSDTPLEAWPYLETEFGDVYSNPACFFVGEQHWISGAQPNEKWEETLREAKISDTAIDRIRDRFDSDRRKRIELASAEDTVKAEPE